MDVSRLKSYGWERSDLEEGKDTVSWYKSEDLKDIKDIIHLKRKIKIIIILCGATGFIGRIFRTLCNHKIKL